MASESVTCEVSRRGGLANNPAISTPSANDLIQPKLSEEKPSTDPPAQDPKNSCRSPLSPTSELRKTKPPERRSLQVGGVTVLDGWEALHAHFVASQLGCGSDFGVVCLMSMVASFTTRWRGLSRRLLKGFGASSAILMQLPPGSDPVLQAGWEEKLRPVHMALPSPMQSSASLPCYLPLSRSCDSGSARQSKLELVQLRFACRRAATSATKIDS